MPEARGGDQEELPNVLRRLGAAAETSYRMPEVRAAAGRSYAMPEVRGGSPEEQPHVQGVVAARAPEGQEELLHIQGQEGWP